MSYPLSLLPKLSLLFALLISGMSEIISQENESMTKPPIAKRVEKKLSIHDDTRTDYYFWLNQREDPEVIAYLEAENKYTEKKLKHTEGFQKKLYDEMISRIKQEDQSVPYKDNGYYYYSRFEEGKEYPIYCRKNGSLDAEEEIMLNVNEMAEGYSYYQVAGLSVSPDNNFLAFGVDTLSRRKYDVRIKNLRTNEILDDLIPNTTGSVAWADDNKTFFYTLKDEALRPFKIFKHTTGNPVEEDNLIFHENDETYNISVRRSKSEKYIIIASTSTLTTEFSFLKSDNPNGKFTVFAQRERGLEYYIDHYEENFYIRTNLDAVNFRLMKTSVNNTSKENWTEVIPHRSSVLLEGFEIFKKYLAVEERVKGLTQLRIINWGDNTEHYLNFGEETYSAYISTNKDYDTEILRYGYSSLTTPSSTYDYNMNTKEKTLLKQDEVLGGFNPDNYYAERLYATASDGSKIPISLVYRKGLKKDGNNPLLLYGYGSYGISTDAAFSSVRLSLLDRGFVYAIAHIRGGQEMGRLWYEDGKYFKKKNTFTDFIACAEQLIESGFTNKEKMFAMGGSAGGLLMGAVINMRPDLFKGVVAAVPFVDVVTTMLDESIPLTTGEYDEWGNPNQPDFYKYMLSYSPYDNVEAKNYPNLLVTTGLHDSQVQYWEPAKWVAKLRYLKTDKNLLLLHTNMESGHGGASGRFKRIKEIALEYVFFLNLLNMNE
ncbi:MAG: oligopeptidase B [Ignavibacteria bacterium CG2_30_36_16]|nr:S9 family peptidase [Ignavibacteria bacterium]OIP63311.1 MAG: oligopeptidase B [Ignavibacteria bacterium CG2_30_36_16]PJB00795.1 MAG: oligopeptidase B [Ignavibacteria bacterium CG_4_9_14_3_um_filter_36_18]